MRKSTSADGRGALASSLLSIVDRYPLLMFARRASSAALIPFSSRRCRMRSPSNLHHRLDQDDPILQQTRVLLTGRSPRAYL